MSLSLARRFATRELRGGLQGFRLFLACLALGVAAIAAVGTVRASIEAGLARAAAPRPDILLADEPTGNLDEANGSAIMDLLFGLRDRHGATLVLVTHAAELAARCDRVVRLRDGAVDPDTARAAE